MWWNRMVEFLFYGFIGSVAMVAVLIIGLLMGA